MAKSNLYLIYMYLIYMYKTGEGAFAWDSDI